MLSRLVLTSLLLVTAPAHAFDTEQLGQLGSLAPEDKQALFAKSPKLESEVAAALSKLGKTIEDVPCDGMRFPGSWKELGGLRVSPYLCQFGEQWLKIRTKVVVTGKGGKVFPTVTRQAMQQATDAGRPIRPGPGRIRNRRSHEVLPYGVACVKLQQRLPGLTQQANECAGQARARCGNRISIPAK